MTRRHVLHLDATQLVAYRWRAGNVTESARFAANADGHAAFAEFLRERPDGLYLMLCDLADESFVSEMVPFVRGPDRSALVRRKLSQLFFGTPLACARSLGRGRTGRRDEQILFCSLTRPATLEPWLAALRSAEVALSGIHSVALASEPVLERMQLTEGQTLLLHISAAGVRQSFFENGRLRFSRLTPLTALSSNDLPRACAEEARRLHPYLLSQRLITRNTPLSVRVLVPPARMDEFALACRATEALQFDLIDSQQAAGKLGLRPAPDDLYCETLFVQALMRRPPAEQFAPAAERRFFRIWQTRFALRAAGSVALAACLLMSAHTVLDSIELRQAGDRVTDEARRAETARRDIIARLPPTPVPLETLRVVHERSLQLEQRSTGPAALLATLGAALERYPQVHIEQLDWKLVSTGAQLSANALAPVSALPPVEARLVVQARLPAEYSARQRSALELVDALAVELGRDPGMQARITRQPFDLESGQVLRGGARSERAAADSTPQFTLQIGRVIAP